ncbi:MAG: hypothetical protein ABID38_07260 [Candidatus Diapherotrites archaeon]
MNKAIFGILLILLAGLVYAIPEITSAPDSFSHQDIVEIRGIDFGSKPVNSRGDQRPLLWDDFENGMNDQVIPIDHDTSQTDSWTYNVGDAVYSSEHNRAGSTLSSKHDLSGDDSDPYGKLRKLYWQTDESLKKLFVSFWVRFSWGYDIVHQTKLWRVCNADNTIIFKNGHWTNPPSRSSIAMRQMEGGEIQAYYHNIHPADGEWYRVELQAEQSSPGVSDGSIELWNSRPSGPIVKVLDLHSVMTTASEDSWEELIIGQAVTNVTGGVSAGTINYFDDVYLDNSWARIELCDQPSYSDRQKCEIQIPELWSETEITFQANQGTFTEESTAYLYVVDANGAVNETGYEITFGAAPPCPENTIRSCSTGEQGICATGEQTCSEEVWGECVQTQFPETEICDDAGNEDEDCDGLSNCGDTEDCSTNPACIVPICADGTNYDECSVTQPLYCDNGSLVDDCSQCDCPNISDSCETYGSCTECVPTPEICSGGTDDDCDLDIDCDDSDCSTEPECEISSNYILKLDFGTISSPVEDGWTQVHRSPEPSLAVDGYGWSGTPQNGDYGGSALTGDFQYLFYFGTPPIFSILLENGDYLVTIYAYSPIYGNDSDLVDISAEEEVVLSGVQLYPISEPAINSFNVTVADGQLDISSSGTLYLNALAVEKVIEQINVDASACISPTASINICTEEELQYEYDSESDLQNVVTGLTPDVDYAVSIENITQSTSNTLTIATDNSGTLEFSS